MTDDPFLTLVIEALNLMHPRFAATSGRAYEPGEDGSLKWREQPFLREFYHAFRTLWDRAVPVGLGLGHVVIASESAELGPFLDLLLSQIGERGQPDRRLGAVSLTLLTNSTARSADHDRLRRAREIGYAYAVSVVLGRWAEVSSTGLPAPQGIAVVFFDVDRWAARIVEG